MKSKDEKRKKEKEGIDEGFRHFLSGRPNLAVCARGLVDQSHNRTSWG